jgi:predicted ArsR family transcriptional regulator
MESQMADAHDLDELDQSRAETRAAFENRALLYAYVYEELSDELGEERATELMERAIHRRGIEVGRKYRPAAAARDLEEVGRIFCDGSPCEGALFEPAVEEVDDERTVLSMSACPLVDAWRGAGLLPEEIDHLCSIAAAVDEGTFESAGLELTFLDRLGRPGSERCLLEITLPDRG